MKKSGMPKTGIPRGKFSLASSL